MSRCVGVVRMGVTPYLEAIALQNKVAERLKQGQTRLAGVLFLLQHPHVYTLGVRKKGLSSEEESKVKALGAEVIHTGRGGLVTYHGPGQLIGWPVLDLRRARSGTVRGHVSAMEGSVLGAAAALGVSAEREPGLPGVWVRGAKLAALGVRASRYVTTHGLALNANVDLSWFDHIVPCGISRPVTSLSQELSRDVSVQEVIEVFLLSFQLAFDCTLTILPLEALDDQMFI